MKILDLGKKLSSFLLPILFLTVLANTNVKAQPPTPPCDWTFENDLGCNFDVMIEITCGTNTYVYTNSAVAAKTGATPASSAVTLNGSLSTGTPTSCDWTNCTLTFTIDGVQYDAGQEVCCLTSNCAAGGCKVFSADFNTNTLTMIDPC